MIEIKINTGNAAFADENFGWEINRILRKLSKQCPHWSSNEELAQNIKDINGNTVGSVKVTPE